MVRNTKTIIVAVLFALFLPTQILGTYFAGIGRSLTQEIQDAETVPCEPGYMSVRDRGNFELGQTIRLSVSTSQCSLFVELLDRWNWVLLRRNMAYAAFESFVVPAGGFVEVFPPTVDEIWGVAVRVNLSSSSSTNVALIWTYPYFGPTPSEAALAVGLLLISGISVFLGLVFLVRGTRRPEVGAMMAALIGMAFPLSFYAFAPSTADPTYIFLNHLVWSSLFLGLSAYFVTRRALPQMPLGWRLAVAIVGYLIVGAAIITLATPLATFAGVPIVLIPFWPNGVVFMFFAEQLYDPALLMLVVWGAWLSAVAGGMGFLFFSDRYHRDSPARTSAIGDAKHQP